MFLKNRTLFAKNQSICDWKSNYTSIVNATIPSDLNGLILWLRADKGVTLVNPSVPQPTAFDNAAWSKANVTIDANDIADPDGGNLGYKVTEVGNESSIGRYLEDSIPGITSGNPITFKIRVKSDDWQWFYITNAGLVHQIWFDIQNGVIGTENGGTGTITDLGDGWYLCEAAFATTAGAGCRFGFTTSNSTQAYLDVDGGRIGWIYLFEVIQRIAVSEWRDLSGSNHNATQTTAGQRPIWKSTNWQNSKPGIIFNGTDQWMQFINDHAFTETSEDYTVIFRRYLATGVSGGVLLSSAGGRVGVWYTTRQFYDGSVVTFDPIAFNTGAYVNDPSNLEISLYADGVITSDSPRTTLDGSRINGITQLGRYFASANQYLNSTCVEIIIFNEIKTSEEISALSTYLSAAWPTG